MFFILLLFFSSFSFADSPNEHDIINKNTTKAINNFKDEINKIANILIALAAISSVLIFIVHFIRLASAYNHPMFRYRIIREIYISGICTALIGAIGLMFKLYIGIYM